MEDHTDYELEVPAVAVEEVLPRFSKRLLVLCMQASLEARSWEHCNFDSSHLLEAFVPTQELAS